MKLKIKLKFFASLLLTLIIFIFLFIGLKKENLYTPSEYLNKSQINFTGIEFFTNNQINFKDIVNKKKYSIINIWSSWCAPCKAEHKFVTEINNFENVILIGLNYKDKKTNAKSFLNELGNPYQIIIEDLNGLISVELGAYGVPETYIINNENQEIIKKFVGPLDKKKLKEIKLVLNL